MPALKPTEFIGEITWIGCVSDREAALASAPLDMAELTWDGIVGEAHGGVNRPSCSRVAALHARGTEIRNTRQLSVVAAEDLDAIGKELGIAAFNPAWIGASLVVRGIPDFSRLPPSSRLQGPSGATLVVDMENRPCNLPVPVIEAAAPGKGKPFRAAAWAKRGVTAWVERPGEIAVGDSLQLFIPDQPEWAEYEGQRSKR